MNSEELKIEGEKLSSGFDAGWVDAEYRILDEDNAVRYAPCASRLAPNIEP